MTDDKLTNEDAQSSLRAGLTEALEQNVPAPWRVKRWKKLAKAKEVKVFHNEGEVVYSKPLEALQVQARAMENISKIAGDYPSQGLRFEGSNGENIIFECHFDGKKEEKNVEGA